MQAPRPVRRSPATVQEHLSGAARRFLLVGIALPTGVFQEGFDQDITGVVPRDYIAGIYGVRGDVTTVSSDRGPSIMPFERIESFLVSPGERRGFDVVVTSGGPEDGWSRVTFLVEVTARF